MRHKFLVLIVVHLRKLSQN